MQWLRPLCCLNNEFMQKCYRYELARYTLNDQTTIITPAILGILKNPAKGHLLFVPSHRRQPHYGSRIAFPDENILRELVGHYNDGAIIGHFALGEFIYANGSSETKMEPWMHLLSPEVQVRFSIQYLVARRTMGLGKSNFNKLWLSELSKQ